MGHPLRSDDEQPAKSRWYDYFVITDRPSHAPRFYLPELDGLRFIAFLLVFIHNAPSISADKY